MKKRRLEFVGRYSDEFQQLLYDYHIEADTVIVRRLRLSRWVDSIHFQHWGPGDFGQAKYYAELMRAAPTQLPPLVIEGRDPAVDSFIDGYHRFYAAHYVLHWRYYRVIYLFENQDHVRTHLELGARL